MAKWLHPHMPTIIVASTNPVKINSAKNGFTQMFPEVEHVVEGLNAPSGVPDQPMGLAETLLGARNRIAHIRRERPEADYWVGIEGGLIEDGSDLVAMAWIVIADKTGRESKASTGTFVIPLPMAELVRQGVEMGLATDKIHGTTNTKSKGGTVGILTNDLIDRTLYYTHAAILALIPFRNSHLY